MKTLSFDTSRCAGRYDFGPDAEWCPERDTCQRYLAFTEWDKAAGVENYRRIGVTMAVPECKIKIDTEGS